MQNDAISHDHPVEQMNAEQLATIRQIAQQKMVQALEEFARQLPQGPLYLQEAINAAGAILDQLERRTRQYHDPSQPDVASDPNWDLAEHREEVAGIEESEEIKDFDMS
jgi:hypothetical protein